jgi:hypothetical protein
VLDVMCKLALERNRVSATNRDADLSRHPLNSANGTTQTLRDSTSRISVREHFGENAILLIRPRLAVPRHLHEPKKVRRTQPRQNRALRCSSRNIPTAASCRKLKKSGGRRRQRGVQFAPIPPSCLSVGVRVSDSD